MILGQLEMEEHQTKCRALVHIIVIIVISITMMMEILVIDIVIITSSKARATFPCAERSELSCVHSVHNRPFGFPSFCTHNFCILLFRQFFTQLIIYICV